MTNHPPCRLGVTGKPARPVHFTGLAPRPLRHSRGLIDALRPGTQNWTAPALRSEPSCVDHYSTAGPMIAARKNDAAPLMFVTESVTSMLICAVSPFRQTPTPFS